MAQPVKNLPAMQETLVQFLGQEDPLEKGKATHSSILGLPCWLRRSRICLQCRRPGFKPWVRKIPWRREWQPTPVFLPGEFPGQRKMGYSSWSRKVTKLCLTLWDPMDCSPPGSSIYGISQAKILEWVAISFSGGSSWPRDQTCTLCGSCFAGGFFTSEPPGKPCLMWNVEHFIPRTRWEYTITLFLFNHYTNGLAGTIREEKVIKSIKLEKEVKLPLVSDDITVDVRITKNL